MMGNERVSAVIAPEVRKLTAYHEGSHKSHSNSSVTLQQLFSKYLSLVLRILSIAMKEYVQILDKVEATRSHNILMVESGV